MLRAAARERQRLAEQQAALLQRQQMVDHERNTLAQRAAALEADSTALLNGLDVLHARVTPLEHQLAAAESELSAAARHEQQQTAALRDAETELARVGLDVQRARDRSEMIWERAAVDAIDIEQLARTTAETPDLPAGADQQETIRTLRARIARLGPVNPLALEEYDQANTRYAFLGAQLDDLRRAAAALGELIQELDTAMRARFETTFRKVAIEFEQSFTRLFGGGEAHLQLTQAEGAVSCRCARRRYCGPPPWQTPAKSGLALGWRALAHRICAAVCVAARASNAVLPAR